MIIGGKLLFAKYDFSSFDLGLKYDSLIFDRLCGIINIIKKSNK